jgi:uncharacterized membrane protein YqhA
MADEMGAAQEQVDAPVDSSVEGTRCDREGQGRPKGGRAAEAVQRGAVAARRTTAYTRFIAAIPAFGFFVSSMALAIGTLVAVLAVTFEYAEGHMELAELSIEFVEFADLFLSSVVLYILGLGLVSLFISDSLPLPSWLVFRDFDDLKERLVSVIGAMLGVYFLGYVLNGASGFDVLWMGIGVAVVVAALSVFVRSVLKKGGHH